MTDLPDIKQVIVIRKDLKMRRGKEIAQGAHATMFWLVERLNQRQNLFLSDNSTVRLRGLFTKAEEIWLSKTGMKKITVYVNSEAELLDLRERAKAKGLEAHIVTDSGLTEFKGIPTMTALAIGPALASSIDEITSTLPLY